MDKKNKLFLKDFIILYFKCLFKIKLNYYDLSLINILDEYDYILDYKKEWCSRYER